MELDNGDVAYEEVATEGDVMMMGSGNNNNNNNTLSDDVDEEEDDHGLVIGDNLNGNQPRSNSVRVLKRIRIKLRP